MNKSFPFTILTSTGFGGTGSSAATNILEEFSSVTSLGSSFECTFLHEADGLYDLEKAITEGHRLKTDLAVNRFLALAERLNKEDYYKKYFNGLFYSYAVEFIESITDCKWNGSWHRSTETKKISNKEKWRIFFAGCFFRILYEKKTLASYEPDGWTLFYNPESPYYYINKKNDFYEKSKLYIKKIFSSINVKSNYLLIDQLIPAYSIDSYSRYFNSIKVFVIDRDPRDLYALNKAEWGTGYIPSNSLDSFINWYRATRFERYKINTEWKDNALFLPFESLIYDYDSSLEKIKTFTGLTMEEHIRQKQCFDPAKSIVNTQVYKRYPQLKDDIEKIENELKEFCFPFEKYPEVSVSVFPDTHIFIEDIKKGAEYLQETGKLPPNYRGKIGILIVNATTFVSTIKTFKMRKTKKSKYKGLIKACLSFPLFPFEILLFPILFIYCQRREN